ncbi:aminopeptidase P family protein [Methyloceanibacter caenitepidi]|uniref:Xaa-Pro aminopeptidase n=1 Tax=Methyloceanibacter caenitepidi TaxID=1384459 RepID=A0A0A8K4V2_9HYPH|nr:aminopeptidase P family protein [Methyloceanibacter caenitepidi]BAQ17044.1 Xaa-Pro aminopeptidase [Methyloceanibacter caenitepidi]
MYQVFDETGAPAESGERVKALLRELKQRQLKGFLVPHSDQHQNEFLPPSEERLAWLTGFTGSAGVAVVAENGSALFVDGRYILQAPKQVDTDLFEVLQIPKAKPSEWVKEKLARGNRLGYDPRLHTISEIERLTKTLSAAGIRLTPVDDNPIDKIWGKDRPSPPRAEIFMQPLEFAGKGSGEKLMQVQMDLVEAEHDAVLLTAPDSICWLFNIRGADIKHTPVTLAYAIVPAKGRPTLFIDPQKIGESVRIALKPYTEIAAPEALDEALTELAKSGAKVRLDPGSASMRFASVLQAGGAKHVSGDDPCTMPKAIKTDAEQAGARAAHLRDGAAMARFLAWLDEVAETGRIDEVSAAMKLEDFRRETGQLKDISFDTIAASGPHGAVVHYRPTTESKRVLDKNNLFLIDSGGQYADGTTDVTRTIAVGKPTAEMKRHYGLVLRSHIAIAAARFPAGSRGQDLDPFARGPLWAAGLDFDHGTGHGVGSYLSVHEGPQRISRLGTEELEPGMILSNEPGYYREGQYGIRLENLVLVTPAEQIEGGERKMLGFETLTLVPFDRRLIDPKQFLPWELAWLNDYHARVREKIEPLIASEDRPWLRHATAPIR